MNAAGFLPELERRIDRLKGERRKISSHSVAAEKKN
jgi:hypothetical protein